MTDDRDRPGRVRAWLDRHAPIVDDDHPWAGPSRLDRADGAGTHRPDREEVGRGRG